MQILYNGNVFLQILKGHKIVYVCDLTHQTSFSLTFRFNAANTCFLGIYLSCPLRYIVKPARLVERGFF